MSCNQDERLDNGYEYLNEPITTRGLCIDKDSISNIIQFSYKGSTYISECMVTESSIQIENDSVRNIFDKLRSKPNVAICVYSDSSIEFFDSIEEMYQSNLLKRNLTITRATTDLSKKYIRNFDMKLWKDAKGRSRGGDYLVIGSDKTQGDRSPSTLYFPERLLTKTINNRTIVMDNAISSVQMWGEIATNTSIILTGLSYGQYQHASVTFFDGGDFTGESLTFDDISVTKDYSERDYFSSFSFNDLTSSIKVEFY